MEGSGNGPGSGGGQGNSGGGRSGNSGRGGRFHRSGRYNKNRPHYPHQTNGQGVRPPSQNRPDDRGPQAAQGTGPQTAQKDGPPLPNRADQLTGNRPRYSGRPHNNNRDNNRAAGQGNPQGQGRPSPQSEIEAFFKKYDHFFDMYLSARKKFFEAASGDGTPDGRRMERNYYSALEQLRRLEYNLPPHLKRALDRRQGRFYMDQSYSDKIKADPTLDKPLPEVPGLKYENPHILESQKATSFKEDSEQSSGTDADYRKLKGISETPLPN